jgi:hypothetical protein
MKNPTGRLMAGAAFIDAGSNFVAQLDKHQVGGVMFVCITALAVAAVAVVTLVLPLRAALTFRDGAPKASTNKRRKPRAVDNSRKGRPRADNSRQRK